MKHYSQTEEAKENYTSPLLIYINGVLETDKNHVFTKDELVNVLGLSGREIRRQLAKIANYYPVISVSSQKGYRIGKFDDNDDVQVLSTLYDDTCHAIAELQSRVVELQARMKPLIALKEVLKDHIVSDSGMEDALAELDAFDFDTIE